MCIYMQNLPFLKKTESKLHYSYSFIICSFYWIMYCIFHIIKYIYSIPSYAHTLIYLTNILFLDIKF